MASLFRFLTFRGAWRRLGCVLLLPLLHSLHHLHHGARFHHRHGLSATFASFVSDRLFETDKRHLVVTLRDLQLVEEFAGAAGRLRFATTETFLQSFGLASLQELTAASLSG
jgi:hypothetical protein